MLPPPRCPSDEHAELSLSLSLPAARARSLTPGNSATQVVARRKTSSPQSPGSPWLVTAGLAHGRFRFLMSVTLTHTLLARAATQTHSTAEEPPFSVPSSQQPAAPNFGLAAPTCLASVVALPSLTGQCSNPSNLCPVLPIASSANCFFSFFSLGPSLAAAHPAPFGTGW